MGWVPPLEVTSSALPELLVLLAAPQRPSDCLSHHSAAVRARLVLCLQGCRMILNSQLECCPGPLAHSANPMPRYWVTRSIVTPGEKEVDRLAQGSAAALGAALLHPHTLSHIFPSVVCALRPHQNSCTRISAMASFIFLSQRLFF